MRLLNIGDDIDTREDLQNSLDAGVARVKRDVGDWDEDVDVPTAELRKAVLRYVQVQRDNAPDDGWRTLDRDHIYMGYLKGYRRSFGIA